MRQEFHMSATIFDLIIIITFIFYLVGGYITGFISQFSGIFSLVAAFWAMSQWTDLLVPYLPAMESSWRPIVAAVIIFFTVMILVGILARILEKILIFSHAGWLNKICGVIASLIKCIIIWTLIFLLLEYFFPSAEFVQSSFFLPYFNKIIESIRQWLPQDLIRFPG